MTLNQLRTLFLQFMQKKQHVIIPSSPIVPINDPSTLFTSSGMQPLVTYLAGESKHPQGSRLANVQKCLRAADIEEVGDNRHTTAFEMLGNWSLGDYFKEQQLTQIWEFYTQTLGLDPIQLHVSVFVGSESVPRDEESLQIWQKLGVPSDHIHFYGVNKNWWSRSGEPEKMPIGEIGGPDSEIFFDFGTPHDSKYGQKCHPNCDCGRFIEIGNSVFIQYQKSPAGILEKLPLPCVDFGGGLERVLAAVNHCEVFQTDAFAPVIHVLQHHTNQLYESENGPEFRIIADHLKAVTFLLTEGVVPANKAQGYVMRRLLRRSLFAYRKLMGSYPAFENIQEIIAAYLEIYSAILTSQTSREEMFQIVQVEWQKFAKILSSGESLIAKIKGNVDGKTAFDLNQSHGIPFELIEQIAYSLQKSVDSEAFEKLRLKHQSDSKAGATTLFRGGLADSSTNVVRFHTTTHLLHQALFDVMGQSIRQEGSNITGERLRFDFYCQQKPSATELLQIENIINHKISENLPVRYVEVDKNEAISHGARSFFREKYPDQVKVYYIGENPDWKQAYSKELCGGPHVGNTQEIPPVNIKKLEKIGANIYRIYIKVKN